MDPLPLPAVVAPAPTRAPRPRKAFVPRRLAFDLRSCWHLPRDGTGGEQVARSEEDVARARSSSCAHLHQHCQNDAPRTPRHHRAPCSSPTLAARARHLRTSSGEHGQCSLMHAHELPSHESAPERPRARRAPHRLISPAAPSWSHALPRPGQRRPLTTDFAQVLFSHHTQVVFTGDFPRESGHEVHPGVLFREG